MNTITKELTIGDLYQGCFVKCGKENNIQVWKVEHLDYWEIGAHEGKVKDLIMYNKEGKKKSYAFLEKDVEFNNGILVNGFEYDSNEEHLILKNKLKEILSSENKSSNKIKLIQDLINE